MGKNVYFHMLDREQFLAQAASCGLEDPESLYWTINPPEPMFIGVYLHPDTGEVCAALSTAGPLSWRLYCLGLQFDKRTQPEAYEHFGRVQECVLAMPGRDLVEQAWIAGLPMPPGVNPLEVAGLTPFKSTYVAPPSVEECHANLECQVLYTTEYHDHRIVFVRVIGGPLDTSILNRERTEVMAKYPLYEVDEVPNGAGGRRLRVGLMGQLYPCPQFPVGVKGGFSGTYERWLGELCEENYISLDEYIKLLTWYTRFLDLYCVTASSEREAVTRHLTETSTMIVWQEWERLHRYLAEH